MVGTTREVCCSPSPMVSVGTEPYDNDKAMMVIEEKVKRLKKECEETRKSERAKSTKLLNEVNTMTEGTFRF